MYRVRVSHSILLSSILIYCRLLERTKGSISPRGMLLSFTIILLGDALFIIIITIVMIILFTTSSSSSHHDHYHYHHDHYLYHHPFILSIILSIILTIIISIILSLQYDQYFIHVIYRPMKITKSTWKDRDIKEVS